MLTLLVWGGLAFVSRTIAQQAPFMPLANYSDVQSQPLCVSNCVDHNNGTLDDAKQRCGDLSELLGGVEQCAQMACLGDQETDVYKAKSLVAAFCSSVATAYSLTVFPTSIVPPTVTATETGTSTTTGTSAPASTDSITEASATVPVAGTGGTVTGPSATIGYLQPSGIPPANATNSTTTPVSKASAGLSSGAKAGLGVGVGLGVPLLVGLVVLAFMMSKRRKTRGAGPYGPVMLSDKSAVESSSYQSPQMEPQEMQPMGSTAPFLPALSTRFDGAKGHAYEEHASAPDSAAEHQPSHRSIYAAPNERPATSRDVPISAAPSINTRPTTAPHLTIPTEHEPPSPVSPISPVSPVDSRPASLRG